MSRVATQTMRNAGFDLDQVAGCFTFACGLNMIFAGDSGMQVLAEKMAEATGDAPTLGILGAPELGAMGDGITSVGAYMYSALILSTVPVSQPIQGRTFTSGGNSSQFLTKTGRAVG